MCALNLFFLRNILGGKLLPLEDEGLANKLSNKGLAKGFGAVTNRQGCEKLSIESVKSKLPF